jgi:hypothetical protein
MKKQLTRIITCNIIKLWLDICGEPVFAGIYRSIRVYSKVREFTVDDVLLVEGRDTDSSKKIIVRNVVL